MDHRGTCKSDSGNPYIQGDIYRDKDTNFEKINQFEQSQKFNTGHSCQGWFSNPDDGNRQKHRPDYPEHKFSGVK